MESSNQALQTIIDESLRRASTFIRVIMPKALTAQEIIDLINVTKNAVIATIKKDGSPHTAWNPLAYVDNKVYTYADPNSACYKHLKRDGRVSIAIPDKNKAVFIEGEAIEIDQVSNLADTLLPKILTEVKGWIPKSARNYTSLAECSANIFEIKIKKILSYIE